MAQNTALLHSNMKSLLVLLLLSAACVNAAVGPGSPSGTVVPGGSTNVALLNGTNIFTGTNTFTPNLLTFSDGSRPSLRLVASTNQIVFVPNITNNYVDAGYATNNGDWNNGKAYPLTRLTVPALPAGSTNARVLIDYQLGWTNNNSACVLLFYAGPNTNWIGSVATSGNTSSPFISLQTTSLNELLQFYGSRTNQFARLFSGLSVGQADFRNQLVNYFDGGTNWDLYIAIQSPHSLSSQASGNVTTNTIWYPVSVHVMDR